jgi:hypothetical protein
MQEADLERQEEKLAEDQARCLYPPNGWSLPSELGKLCERIAGTEDDRAVEAKQLSRLIREISDALVDLNVLPIQDIPSRSWSAKDVLAAFSVVLDQLREEALVRKPET